MRNRNSPITAILGLLGLLAFSPIAQAVSPPPDGGYPGFTTAEGTNALKNLTAGSGNTALGWYSLFTDTTGSFNTGVGAGTLVLSTGDENTGVGVGALFSNTTGFNNTAMGFLTLFSNVDGIRNNAVGSTALYSHLTGNYNNAMGTGALFADTDGISNNAFGDDALTSNTTGSINTAIGDGALASNTIGSNNTAVGQQALLNSTGNANTAIGGGALIADTFGFGNTAAGVNALENNTTGHDNIALGVGAGANVITANNVICIGAPGNDLDDSCYIGNIFNATSVNGVGVFVNSNGRLGTTTSSKRFKEQIKPMDSASEALLALHPVTFRYKKEIDPRGTAQFGLVAEEVERVNPDLVVRDKDGKPYSVRYDQVNAMLLNEFLKEHRKNEAQEASIAELKKEVQALTAGLQKMSAQVELREPITKTVVNNQR